MSPFHKRFVNLVGTVSGTVRVLGEAQNDRGAPRWRCICIECDEIFFIGIQTIREKLNAGGLSCPWCKPEEQKRRARPMQFACTHCHEQGHTRAQCPQRDRNAKGSGRCSECSGQAHRREVPVCPGCELPHVPLAPLHAVQFLKQPDLRELA